MSKMRIAAGAVLVIGAGALVRKQRRRQSARQHEYTKLHAWLMSADHPIAVKLRETYDGMLEKSYMLADFERLVDKDDQQAARTAYQASRDPLGQQEDK